MKKSFEDTQGLLYLQLLGSCGLVKHMVSPTGWHVVYSGNIRGSSIVPIAVLRPVVGKGVGILYLSYPGCCHDIAVKDHIWLFRAELRSKK